MNNRLHDRDDAGPRRPRSLASLAASLALLAILLVTQGPARVQAAPTSTPDSVKFKIYAEQVSAYPGQVCVGDTVEFKTRVIKSTIDNTTRQWVDQDLLFIKVTATVYQPDILKLTSESPTPTVFGLDIGDTSPTASFSFKGLKRGTATLSFDAMAPDGYLSRQTQEELREALYVSVTTQIEVIECNLYFERIDRTRGAVPGEGRVGQVGVVGKTQLRQTDTEGKEFAATTTKDVIIVSFGGPCRFSISLGTRAVQIKAHKLSTGGYRVEYTQGPAQFTYTSICREGTGSAVIEFPDPGDRVFETPESGGPDIVINAGPGFMSSASSYLTVDK